MLIVRTNIEKLCPNSSYGQAYRNKLSEEILLSLDPATMALISKNTSVVSHIEILLERLHLAFSLAWIPALAMVTLPCSITPWIPVRSASVILSNSSMQTTPRSPSTIAPAWSLQCGEKYRDNRAYRQVIIIFGTCLQF